MARTPPENNSEGLNKAATALTAAIFAAEIKFRLHLQHDIWIFFGYYISLNWWILITITSRLLIANPIKWGTDKHPNLKMDTGWNHCFQLIFLQTYNSRTNFDNHFQIWFWGSDQNSDIVEFVKSVSCFRFKNKCSEIRHAPFITSCVCYKSCTQLIKWILSMHRVKATQAEGHEALSADKPKAIFWHTGRKGLSCDSVFLSHGDWQWTNRASN